MSTTEAHDQTDALTISQEIAQRLQEAWNSGDHAAFAEPFSSDADFVAIRGDLHSGRDAIAAGHEQIFRTIYAGSTIRYEVVRARELDERIVLAHVRAALDAPTGPLAGQHSATITLVLRGQDDRYEITAFHNTLVTG